MVRQFSFLNLGLFVALAALVVFLLINRPGLAADEVPGEQPEDTVVEAIESVPGLADIVPLETKLARSLRELEKQLQAGIDQEQLETRYAELEASITPLSEKFELLKESDENIYNRLVDLRELVKQKKETFEAVNRPVAELVQRLGSLREEWQREAERWNNWRDKLLTEGGPELLNATFADASATISRAADLILSELDATLTIQEQAGILEQQIETLAIDIDDQIIKERRKTLFNDTPSMLSRQYYEQLKDAVLWWETTDKFQAFSLPERETINQHGWIVLLNATLAILLVVGFSRSRHVFEKVKQWRCIAQHPITSGIFLSYMVCALIYEYQGVPNSWKLGAAAAGGIAFMQLTQGIVSARWKYHFVVGLIAAILVTRLVDVLGFPIPAFRLYTFVVSLAGVILCSLLVKHLVTNKEPALYAWLFRAGIVFFVLIAAIELMGKKALASYLFVSFIRSVGTTMIFVLLMYLVRGWFEWLFATPLLKQAPTLGPQLKDMLVVRLTRFVDLLIIVIAIIPAILQIWGIFPSLEEATLGVLAAGFTVGGIRITVSLLLVAAAILYGSFLISWVVQNLLVEDLLFKRRMERAARVSIAKLVHYGIILIGILLAVSALGIELSKLTIMVSALGVGIGFGLKDIINNFVSGLILLFEQPIRIGDIVELDGMWAEIQRIGIRSTVVRNFDHADMIIPNADLIVNRVTNWTLGGQQVRLIIQVGVAYGSDLDLVTRTLMACAEDNESVSATPGPQVLFLNFGDSTLDFELRVFVPASRRLSTKNELNHDIDKRFRENGIVIAFPQRDLHLPELVKTELAQKVSG
jgi:small-conductance mechanosensitive channel